MEKQLILAALLFCTIHARGEDYILATGQNGTETVYVSDFMVYTQWLDDAVLWMPFPANETAGTYYDYSLQGNDGSQGTAGLRPTFVTNGWFDFDGSDDHFERTMPEPDAGDNNTLTMWMIYDVINPGNNQSAYHLTDDSGGRVITVGNWDSTSGNNKNDLLISRATDSVTNASEVLNVLSAATWMHLACVYDSGVTNTYAVYINGVLQTLNIPAGAYFGEADDNNVVHVGERNGSLPFNGKLDDIRHYTRALASNEVFAIYNTTAAGHP